MEAFAFLWLTGSRLQISAQMRYDVLVRFRIRHRTDVRSGWRLVHGSSTYEITFTEELGRHHLLDLTCRAIDQPAQN